MGPSSPWRPLDGLRELLALSDEGGGAGGGGSDGGGGGGGMAAFLSRASTSPLHEPPWFVAEMREQYAWVVREVDGGPPAHRRRTARSSSSIARRERGDGFGWREELDVQT
jgi:hypothetical protein